MSLLGAKKVLCHCLPSAKTETGAGAGAGGAQADPDATAAPRGGGKAQTARQSNRQGRPSQE